MQTLFYRYAPFCRYLPQSIQIGNVGRSLRNGCLFHDRGSYAGCVVNTAICTDFIRVRTVAGDIGVADRGDGTERYGDLHANILTDGKHALTVFDAVANGFSRRYRRFRATSRDRHSRIRKRRYRNRYANRRKLIGNSGASLIFVRIIGHFNALEKLN